MPIGSNQPTNPTGRSSTAATNATNPILKQHDRGAVNDGSPDG
jgi:hypothetical protein